ncbi:MAG: hypothetical protein ACRDYF_06085 [Acidimicrobiia bacterium]
MGFRNWIRLIGDRTAAVALFALGGVILLLGWLGVSREVLPARQVPYIISGGMTALFVLGLGGLFWLSAALRDEWARLGSIEAALGEIAGSGLVDPAALELAQPREAVLARQVGP